MVLSSTKASLAGLSTHSIVRHAVLKKRHVTSKEHQTQEKFAGELQEQTKPVYHHAHLTDSPFTKVLPRSKHTCRRLLRRDFTRLGPRYYCSTLPFLFMVTSESSASSDAFVGVNMDKRPMASVGLASVYVDGTHARPFDFRELAMPCKGYVEYLVHVPSHIQPPPGVPPVYVHFPIYIALRLGGCAAVSVLCVDL